VGRFAKQYGDDQKDACALAVVDGEKLYGRELGPSEVVKMAAAGELHGHGPFTINIATVRKEATKLRRERAGKAIKAKRESKDVDGRVEAMVLQLVRVNEFALDRLERRVKRGEIPDAFDQVKKAALAIREIEARKVPPSSHTGRGARKADTEDPAKQATDDNDLVTRMRKAMANEGEPNGNGGGPASSSVAAAGDGEAGRGGATVAGTVAGTVAT
jgi:hypothetical protein